MDRYYVSVEQLPRPSTYSVGGAGGYVAAVYDHHDDRRPDRRMLEPPAVGRILGSHARGLTEDEWPTEAGAERAARELAWIIATALIPSEH